LGVGVTQEDGEPEETRCQREELRGRNVSSAHFVLVESLDALTILSCREELSFAKEVDIRTTASPTCEESTSALSQVKVYRGAEESWIETMAIRR
jgi:hypothetical protein